MTSKMGSITQLAYNAITDDQILMDKLSTPEQVLDYLQDEHNFKDLSSLLKETILNAGYCADNSSVAELSNTLFNLLIKQDVDCNNETKRNKNKIVRWMTGETKTIRYRFDAIEICFALGLDVASSNDFLRKCGFVSFSIRDAEDTTYLYCLLNHRPLSAALQIIDQYNKQTSIKTSNKAIDRGYEHSGHTTVILYNQLFGNSSWENDKDFLSTFLIPNKDKFIGYSYTAQKKYLNLKNILFLTVFIDAVANENHLVLERLEFPNDSDIRQEDISVSLATRSALRKFSNPNSVLFPSNKMLKDDMSNARDVLIDIRRIAESNVNDNVQKEIGCFCNDIMKMEGLLKYVINSIISKDRRIREYSKSKLKNTVMKEFPTDKTFAKYESAPNLNMGLSVRKAIILMYYIAYAYEYSSFLFGDDYQYTPISFFRPNNSANASDEFNMGFVEFMEGLDSILSECGLSQLYPANQFDWLILRSIRNYEVSDYEGETGNPIAFFNDVLAYSFGDTPDLEASD